MTNLNDLARRVMDLQGPSREVDAEIAKAFGLAHGRKEIVHYESRSYTTIDEQALHYTASLDAAMTLVPEGWRPYTLDMSIKGRSRWMLEGPKTKWEKDGDGYDVAGSDWYEQGVAATPALALTAAALLARGDQSDANT